MLKANTKTTRAEVIAAIRRTRGANIRVFAALTPFESANKALVYQYAQKRNFAVVDNGDRAYLRAKDAPTPRYPLTIMLSAAAADVLRALE